MSTQRAPAILIVKTGSAPPALQRVRGDFEDWFRIKLGLDAARAPSVAPPRGEPLPDPGAVPAVLVTGSPAFVTDREPWSVACAAWLREVVAAERPVLGVCYGHQLLADALGGTVGRCPRGHEFGSVRVEVSAEGRGDPLLAGLPRVLDAQAAHLESVLALPVGARRLAGNAHDANQAFAVGACAWGVQFHPEFDADVVRRYAQNDERGLYDDGLDALAIEAAACDSDHGGRILANFLAAAFARRDPERMTDAQRVLWHDARGDWGAAHDVAQDMVGSDGARLHAYLHRKEGDLDNAGYWYGCAGEVMPSGALDEEACSLLARYA